MKYIVAVALGACLLGGCSGQTLPWEEVVKQMDECSKAMGEPKMHRDGWGAVLAVTCGQDTPAARCSKMGGLPITSTWDGRLANCIFPPNK